MPVEGLDPERLLPPSAALRDHPRVTVSGDLVAAVRHGKVLPLDEVGPTTAGSAELDTDEPGWAVLDEEGALLAVYEHHGEGTAKPAVVIAPASG